MPPVPSRISSSLVPPSSSPSLTDWSTVANGRNKKDALEKAVSNVRLKRHMSIQIPFLSLPLLAFERVLLVDSPTQHVPYSEKIDNDENRILENCEILQRSL